MSTKTKIKEVDARLSALIIRMSEKGLVCPKADFWIKGNEENLVYIQYSDSGVHKSEVIGGDGYDALTAADIWVAKLPTTEERNKAAFLKALAATVELGRKNGISVDLVNPLEEMMKTLSEGAITYQPEGEAETPKAPAESEDIFF